MTLGSVKSFRIENVFSWKKIFSGKTICFPWFSCVIKNTLENIFWHLKWLVCKSKKIIIKQLFQSKNAHSIKQELKDSTTYQYSKTLQQMKKVSSKCNHYFAEVQHKNTKKADWLRKRDESVDWER